MSYILDALKKSEQERERERGTLPGIASVHAAADSAGSEKTATTIWLYVAAVVILMSAVVFAYFYLYPMQHTTADVASDASNMNQTEQHLASVDATAPAQLVSESAKTAAIVPPGKTSPVSPDVLSNDAGDAPAPRPQPTPKLADNAIQKPRIPDQRESTAEAATPKVIFSKQYLDATDTVPSDNSAADTKIVSVIETKPDVEDQVNELALHIAELPDDVRQKIPSISFAGHVYSSIKKRRSVMINGRKMREGESVDAELTLHSITPDGAEFTFKGYKFALDALQDWSY